MKYVGMQIDEIIVMVFNFAQKKKLWFSVKED